MNMVIALFTEKYVQLYNVTLIAYINSNSLIVIQIMKYVLITFMWVMPNECVFICQHFFYNFPQVDLMSMKPVKSVTKTFHSYLVLH